jgi:hypothetical protein
LGQEEFFAQPDFSAAILGANVENIFCIDLLHFEQLCLFLEDALSRNSSTNPQPSHLYSKIGIKTSNSKT